MPEAEAIQKRSYQGESEGHEALRERPATEHGEPFAGLGEMGNFLPRHEAFAASRPIFPARSSQAITSAARASGWWLAESSTISGSRGSS
jgi:hypothetical protein